LAQRTKISEAKTGRQLGFPDKTWKFTPSSLLTIQLCKSLPSIRSYGLFLDNFFTNARLLKALKTLNIGACGTAKVESGFPTNLVRLRAAATKEKHWGKMGLMTIEVNKKMNIDEGDVLCMTWVDLNTVQFMTTMHTIDDLKKVTYKNAERRHGIFNAANPAILIDETLKIPFPTPIVEYNTHMRGSDGNAQQRAYYSPHDRLDSRY
jgi:hypothetical protein